jgi:predicted ATPase
MLNPIDEGERALRREEVNPQVSILAQRKDPEHYPEITYLGNEFARFALYRDWEFGGLAPVREPCDVSLPSEFLSEEGDNLGAVLNGLLINPVVKREIIESLKLFYEGASDLRTAVQGGKIQTYFEEKHLKSAIPLIRLSDGTVRWLSLLSILLNPDPPPLVCIEEPELGLHPDMVHELGKLLIDASSRMQIIVTTHSDALVESFTEQPDSVLVCEKESGATKIERLSKERLSAWLDEYSLGQLWRKGEIGGNRW